MTTQIDFYAELNKIYDDDAIQQEQPLQHYCLIMHDPLTSNCVTLDCGHTFNYEPLMRELCGKHINSKKHKLKSTTFSIICPYCKQQQTTLLPYIPTISVIPFMNGVHIVPEPLTNINRRSKAANKGLLLL